MESVKCFRKTPGDAPLHGGRVKNSAPYALPQQPALRPVLNLIQDLFQGRLLWPVLAIVGLFFLYGPVKADWVQPQPNEGVPDSMKAKKSPWGACIASAAIPGAGQFYNGERKKGFLHLTLFAVGTVIYFTGDEHSENEGKQNRHAFGDLLSGVVRVWSAIDAPVSARRINRKNGYTGLKSPGVGLVLVPDPRGAGHAKPGVGLRAGF